MDNYRTPNTALAAYLFTEGFSFLGTETEPHPHNGYDAVFVFEGGKKIEEFARKYQTGQAIGNISLFHMNYRKFIGKAKIAVKMAGL